jgi:hypothetical protein
MRKLTALEKLLISISALGGLGGTAIPDGIRNPDLPRAPRLGGDTTSPRSFSTRPAPSEPLTVDRLSALSGTGRTAPLMENVTIAPHDYSEFTREIRAKSALVGSGGVDF